MVTSPTKSKATKEETKSMISTLGKVGSTLQPLDLKVVFDDLPEEVTSNKEKYVRFLLLTAILDQQAVSPSARKTAMNVYKTFGDDLFYKPKEVLSRLDELKSLEDQYKISPAIGRVTPRFAWLVLRVGGYLIYEMMLNQSRLSDWFKNCRNPEEAICLLHNNPVVESILRDKAVRMYVSWIGHPKLGIDVSQGKWKTADFGMPVDGHVGKVFSRSECCPEYFMNPRIRRTRDGTSSMHSR